MIVSDFISGHSRLRRAPWIKAKLANWLDRIVPAS